MQQQEQPVEDLRNKIVEMNLDDRQEAGEVEEPWKKVQNRKGRFDNDDSSSASSRSEDGGGAAVAAAGGKSQVVQVFIPVVIYEYRPLNEVKEAIESRLGKIVYLSEGPTRTFESGREYNNLRLDIELNNSPEAKMLEKTYMKDERYDFYVDKMDQHFLKIFKGEQHMQRKPTIDLGAKSLPTVVTPMGVVLPRAPFPRRPVAGETPRPLLLKQQQQHVSYLSVAAGGGGGRGGGGPAATVAPPAPPPTPPQQMNLASEDLFPQMKKVAKLLGRNVSTQAREQGETGMDISNDTVPETSKSQQGVSFSAEQMRFLIEMGLVPSQTQQPPFRAPTEQVQNPSAPSGPSASAAGAYPPYYPYPYHHPYPLHPPPPPPTSYPYYYSPSPYGNPHSYPPPPPPPPQSYPHQQQYSQPFVSYSTPR